MSHSAQDTPVLATAGALSAEDVRRLLADPSPEARAATAEKLAQSFVPASMSASEQALTIDILRIMARDAEVQVRQALAENLKSNPGVPRDVALSLARDVDTVSLPVLEASPVLSDEDLIAILRTGAESKQTAIARREGLSETVSRTIAQEAAAPAVAALMGNETARIPDDAFQAAVSRFPAEATVTEAMVRRARLPVEVAEQLVGLVSAGLREQLMIRHELPGHLATDLLLQARERAMVELAWGASRQELIALVARLYAGGRLTPSIVLRALCTGDKDFFEVAMARLAGIPLANAQRLIHDRGGAGLRRLVEHCRLGSEFHDMARIALSVSADLEHDGSPSDRRRIARQVIERVVTSFESAPDSENLDYLIDKLTRLSDETGGGTERLAVGA
jgi:uncharacterized protein (DUF2336 family)